MNQKAIGRRNKQKKEKQKWAENHFCKLLEAFYCVPNVYNYLNRNSEDLLVEFLTTFIKFLVFAGL